jgi:hypothetical protein
MLTAAEQLKFLEANGNYNGAGYARAGRLRWTFETRPSVLGRSYQARIDYWQGRIPKVFVDSPDLLALVDGRKLPHVYGSRPVELCLYYPRHYEWKPWMRLDETIVPWTILWLYYFEIWLDTGEWKGGGRHPTPKTCHPQWRAREAERDE